MDNNSVLYRGLCSTPLLPVALAIAASVAVSLCTGCAVWALLVVATAVAVLSAVISRSLVISAIVLASYVLGVFAVEVERLADDAFDNSPNAAYVYSGIVESITESSRAYSLIVRIDSIGTSTDSMFAHTPARTMWYLIDDIMDVSPGKRIKASVICDESLDVVRLPHERSRRDVLRLHGYVATGLLRDGDVISLCDDNGWRGCLLKVRYALRCKIYEMRISDECKEFLNAVLLGDKSDLRRSDRTVFADAGLSHLLAVSGMHVALIAMIVGWALLWMHALPHGRYIRMVVVMLSVWMYAFITGLGTPVLRASVMLSLLGASIFFDRSAKPFNSLCAAAIVIMLYRPSEVLSVGFQLSFLAVSSILLLSNALNVVPPRNRISYNAVGYITMCFAAVAGTFWLTALHFHQFPLAFLATNIVCVPLLAPTLSLAILALILSVLGLQGYWIEVSVDWLYGVIRYMAHLVSEAGVMVVRDIVVSRWIALPGVLSILSVAFSLRVKSFGSRLMACACVIWLVCMCFYDARQMDEPRIYVNNSHDRTDLLFPADSMLQVLSTAPNMITEAEKQMLKDRLGEYMVNNKLHGVNVLGDLQSGNIVVGLSPCALAVVHHPMQDTVSVRVENVLLCGGFRGDVAAVMRKYNPDTVLLSADLHPSLVKRYAAELSEMGLPVKNLRQCSWSMPISDAPIRK